MYKKIFKRLFDLAVALAALIVLWPVLLLVALLIRIKLGSPVLYKQDRPGVGGEPFYLYKFRSMTDERDENGQLLPNEMRLTSFGRKLRSTSLDELPSLINVLKGEMSFVGPRPLRTRYLPLYSKEQFRRHEVKPGITGYAQANGRSNLSWDEKFRLDIYYVDHVSFLLDIRILFKTFVNVVARRDTEPVQGEFEIPFDDYIKKRNA